MHTLSGKPFLRQPLKIRPCDQKRAKGDGYSKELVSSRWKSSCRELSRTKRDSSSESPATELPAPVRERRRVYVGNLPKPLNNHASDLMLREMFRSFDVDGVSKVKWPIEEMRDRHGWYAFVDFRNADEAQRAVAEKDGARVRDEIFVVAIASDVPEKVVMEAREDGGQ